VCDALVAYTIRAVSRWVLTMLEREALAGTALRSGPFEWIKNGTDHQWLGNPAMGRHSLAILADRSESGPCPRQASKFSRKGAKTQFFRILKSQLFTEWYFGKL
jgi:hypothetical protein